MCGIGGILRITPKGQPVQPIPESWLDAIDEKIAHRGPDGAGRFRDSVVREDGATVEVALVHRRLSIIDHAGGGQPMVSERGLRRADGTDEGLVAVVFNGCIYNHVALRILLERGGRAFMSNHSDTEVFIHGWRQWGTRAFARLDGMYAAAIWDRNAAELVLARDRFGEKPLYFTFSRRAAVRTLAFASTASAVAAIRQAWAQTSRPAASTTRRWLRVGCGRPPVRAIETLPRSCHWQTVSSASPRHSYPPRALRSPAMTHETLVASLEMELDKAVARRLSADAPVCVFLSGGIDSGLIAAIARTHHPDILACTVRMPDPRYDETNAATATAQSLGCRHLILDCAPSPAEDLQHLVAQLGLPFADSSILPTYWLCKAAACHAKVALSGDGGDELFCGYDRHVAARIAGQSSMLRLIARVAPVPEMHPKSPITKIARFFSMLREGDYRELVAIFRRRELLELTGPTPRKDDWVDDAHALVQWDRRHYLTDDLLVKTDTASMSVPIEVRCPILARSIAQLVLPLPLGVLMPGGERKGLLKAVAALYLPPEIVNRPKQGFAIPISDWFRTDFGGMRSCLLDHLSGEKPFGVVHDAIEINMGFVRQMVDEHWAAGGLTPLYSSRAVRKRDHGQRLFALLSLAIWARTLK